MVDNFITINPAHVPSEQQVSDEYNRIIDLIAQVEITDTHINDEQVVSWKQRMNHTTTKSVRNRRGLVDAGGWIL